MSTAFIIKVPKAKNRNPIGAHQARRQVMKDRRSKRPKDAKRSWRREEW